MQKSLYNLKILKKNPWRSLTFSNIASFCNFAKNNTFPWVFFTFFKLHKWFKIDQKVSYSLQDMSHPKNTHPNSNINSNIPFFNLHRYNKTVNKWKMTHMWRNISIWHLLMNLRNNYLFNKLLMWANKNVRILIFTIKHPIDTRWYHYFTPMYQKSWWWYYRQKLVIMGHFKPFYPIVPILPLLKTQKMRILKKWKNSLEIPSFYKIVSKTKIIWDMVPEIWSGTDIIFCHFEPFFALLPTKQPGKPKFWKNEKNAQIYYHFKHVYHKWKSYDV